MVGRIPDAKHRVTIPYSMSAGRMYDSIKKKARAKIVLVTPKGILCKVKKEK